jgi:hypothetical protein
LQILRRIRPRFEKLLRAKKSMEAEELENAEAVLDRAVELAQLFMEATLLTNGFHTHRRQMEA